MSLLLVQSMGDDPHAHLRREPVPHYRDIPKPSKDDILRCRYAYYSLQRYVSVQSGYTYRREVDHGGYMTWEQTNQIRDEIDKAMRPYFEKIRYIGWEGRAEECRAISLNGQKETYRIMSKYFGARR